MLSLLLSRSPSLLEEVSVVSPLSEMDWSVFLSVLFSPLLRHETVQSNRVGINKIDIKISFMFLIFMLLNDYILKRRA